MSCSKPLPAFVCDSLYYLNRDQLERFIIVCRSLKNFIERYFHAKPYRVFDLLWIHGGSYALFHNKIKWHLNRDDYNVQQFLAGQKCSVDEVKNPLKDEELYSFSEMRPYLSPIVRIKYTIIFVAEDSTYNSDHIVEMESITHLWREGEILIGSLTKDDARIGAEDFQLILNSPSILQCRLLCMGNVYFSFKDYQVLYTVNAIEIRLSSQNDDIDPSYLQDFLGQPGVKPIVSLQYFDDEVLVNLLDRLSKAFSSAVVPNAFKVGFIQKMPLNEFQNTNKTSGEKLELKKGLPVEFENEDMEEYGSYTLERSSI